MKYLFFLFTCLVSPLLLTAQLTRLEHADSLFSTYKQPVIDQKVYDQLQQDEAAIYIGCYYATDNRGKITSQRLFPLDGIGNDYLLTDTLWKSVLSSMKEAADKWVFKPIVWSTKNSALDVINKNPAQRPFSGRSHYFVIFELSGGPMPAIHRISFKKI
ncbi:hypothetical protein HNQ91_001977 [Filimonas zeae]|nr:hypothetical protein [Filimonas zeae]MDR6338926.1 hypothetical protein [Filimonas zeae]